MNFSLKPFFVSLLIVALPAQTGFSAERVPGKVRIASVVEEVLRERR